ncbi:Protein LAS1 [Papilio machaon]|uniref:Protein LAS1 n=1 Tax=Papilio machaon TaxID=76193 RepID=A0A194REP7_PAPMA|nr:Protein LAS1 [Papilio machaon]
MSEYYNVVPWFDSKEWHKVYMDIYSPSSTDLTKEDSIEILHVWKARSPILPSGIESTLTLLEVHIQDIKSFDVVGEQIIRLAYSTALMRFVNHMLDSQTSKGSSLYKAAQNLGVPDWMIDLRHDTAHGNVLPSIELLREATSIGLEWLKVNYWDKHKEIVKDYVFGHKDLENDEHKRVRVLMNFCFSLSICAHTKLKIKRLADIPDKSIRASMLNDIKELFGDSVNVSNLKKVTILSLINLINIHSKRLLKSKNTYSLVNEALLGKDSLFLSLDLFNFLSEQGTRKGSSLSKHYVHCFEVLLTYLHTNDLLDDFVIELINITQNCELSNQKRWLAAMWISEILKALKKSSQFVKRINKKSSNNMEKKKKGELKSLFYHWFPNEKGCGLLLDLFKPIPKALTNINRIRPFLTTYNVYLTYFIKDILNLLEPPLPVEISKKICDLTTLIASPMKKCNEKVPNKVFTIFDVKVATNKNYAIQINENEETDLDTTNTDPQRKPTICGIWKLEASENYYWSKCPIGRVPDNLHGPLSDTADNEINEPMDIEISQ